MPEYSGNNVNFTIRIPAEMLESTRIMAAIFTIPISEYIQTAIFAQLDGDIAANIQAYEALRQARKAKAQEKGA